MKACRAQLCKPAACGVPVPLEAPASRPACYEASVV